MLTGEVKEAVEAKNLRVKSEIMSTEDIHCGSKYTLPFLKVLGSNMGATGPSTPRHSLGSQVQIRVQWVQIRLAFS